MKKKKYGLSTYDCTNIKYGSKYRFSKKEVKFFKDLDVKKMRLEEKKEFLKQLREILDRKIDRRITYFNEVEPYLTYEEDIHVVCFNDFLIKSLLKLQDKIDNQIGKYNTRSEIYTNFIDNNTIGIKNKKGNIK